MENAVAAAVGGILGVYVIRVGIAGNSSALLGLLSEEIGYVEFLAALGALYYIHQAGGPFGALVDQLFWVAAIAALLKVAANNTSFFGEMEKFGNGEQSLFVSLGHIFGIGQ